MKNLKSVKAIQNAKVEVAEMKFEGIYGPIEKIEEGKGIESIQELNQVLKEVGMKEEIGKEEIKKVSPIEKVMNEEYMKEIHSNMNGALPKSVKEFIDGSDIQKLKNEEFELVMLTQESRKIYYLLLNDEFIGQYKSIMECKVWTMKLAALLKKEIKIHYFKPGRKNQSSEKISGKSYMDKIEKYQSI